MEWNTTDQEGQEYAREQASWAHYKGFKVDLMGEEDVLLRNRKESGNTAALGSSGGKSQFFPRGFWEVSSKKVMRLKMMLRYPYTNVCIMGNKQEELETTVQLENSDLVTIMETWWDDSCDWNTMTEGCELFRRDR